MMCDVQGIPAIPPFQDFAPIRRDTCGPRHRLESRCWRAHVVAGPKAAVHIDPALWSFSHAGADLVDVIGHPLCEVFAGDG